MARYAKREVRADQKTQPAPTRQRLKGASGAARAAMTIALAALLCAPLAACKDTWALTEIIHDPDATEIDYDAPPTYQLSNDPEVTNEIDSATLSESQRRDQEEARVNPEYSKDQENERQSINYQSGNTTLSDSEATNGQGQEGNPSAQKTEAHDADDATSASESRNGSATYGTPDSSLAPSPEEQDRQTHDQNGQEQDLPNAVHVAATGDYALLVQMLCGEGVLVAADHDFLTGKAATVYADEGIADVETAWTGNGSSPDQMNIDVLLNLAAQDKLDAVVIGPADQGVDATQQAQLEEAGVPTIVLASTKTDDDSIVSAVRDMGMLLAEANGGVKQEYGKTSADMADLYQQMHDEDIESALSANGGYATTIWHDGTRSAQIYQPVVSEYGNTVPLETARFGNVLQVPYVEGWTHFDGGVQYVVPNAYATAIDARPEYLASGLSVARNFGDARETGLLTSWGSFADISAGFGVANKGYFASPTTLYLQSAGLMALPAVFYHTCSAEPSYRFFCAVWPNEALSIPPYPDYESGYIAWFDGERIKDRCTGYFDYWYPSGMIAKTPDIAQRIQVSSNISGGIYHTASPYYVYVMPSGMSGSWGDGGLDAFLMVPWAYSAFHDGDFTVVNEMVVNYADAFYRHDASSVFDNYSLEPYKCSS